MAITDFWRRMVGPHEPVSKEFEHLLMREVMRTELLRVRALIIVAFVIMFNISFVRILFPGVEERIWRGINPNAIYLILTCFILFEWWVHRAISRHLKLDQDVHVLRRYVGALIETSIPSLILSLQIQSMGPVQALGFVMPLVYCIFIILSTLRLDFWLSAFTGFVAGAELFALAMYHKPPVSPDPEPELYYHLTRSLVLLACGILAGTVGVQLRRGFAASIRAATARDRITNLFGQHVSPQVVERLMVEGASTESDIRQVAVMFVDFRSFTAGARSRSPQDVVDRLDGAFAVLVEILDRHGGIVNKFLGDGFLALFGAPFEAEDPAHRAVAAAREMLDAMERINEGIELAAPHRHRHPFRRGGRRQYRLAAAQGIYRDRRHREFRLAAGGAQQGVRFAAPDLFGRARRAGQGLSGRGFAWGSPDQGLRTADGDLAAWVVRSLARPLVIPGRDEVVSPESIPRPWLSIPGLRLTAHPGMTTVRLAVPQDSRFSPRPAPR